MLVLVELTFTALVKMSNLSFFKELSVAWTNLGTLLPKVRF